MFKHCWTGCTSELSSPDLDSSPDSSLLLPDFDLDFCSQDLNLDLSSKDLDMDLPFSHSKATSESTYPLCFLYLVNYLFHVFCSVTIFTFYFSILLFEHPVKKWLPFILSYCDCFRELQSSKLDLDLDLAPVNLDLQFFFPNLDLDLKSLHSKGFGRANYGCGLEPGLGL